MFGSAAAAADKSPAQLLGKPYTLTTLRIPESCGDGSSVVRWVAERVKLAPEFYASSGLVIECADPTLAHSVATGLQGLGRAGPQVVGTVGAEVPGIPLIARDVRASPRVDRLTAVATGSAVVGGGGRAGTSLPLAPVTNGGGGIGSGSGAARGPRAPRPDEVDAYSANGTLTIKTSLRSGQQAYAKGGSLVVLGNVNSGAEAIADGDVVVMGTLSGRALAGLTGNEQAKIYVGKLGKFELVSIANSFQVGQTDGLGDDDALDDPIAYPAASSHTTPTAVFLDDDEIAFVSRQY
jgi:septum site-determining protein MinC